MSDADDSDIAKLRVLVAAGMILRADGHLLLAQRPQGKSWAGWWELPGGKIEPGETARQALVRELHEELGIVVTQATPWVRYTHEYEKTVADLHLWRVTDWDGMPEGRENQALAWVDVQQTPVQLAPLLPATLAPLHWNRLAPNYLLTSIGTANHLPAYLDRLERTLACGGQWMVQFREPAWQLHAQSSSADEADKQSALARTFAQVLALCRRYDTRCLVNSTHPEEWWSQADGVHLRAQDARDFSDKSWERERLTGLVGVSAHNAAELDTARALGADFAVLGHVLPTLSHPDRSGMGWEAFSSAIEYAGLPVYALGGQGADTLRVAQEYGAHGIAGMRRLLAGG